MEYRNDDYVEHFVSEADLMTVRSLEPQADTWYQCYKTFSLSIIWDKLSVFTSKFFSGKSIN